MTILEMDLLFVASLTINKHNYPWGRGGVIEIPCFDNS